MNALHKLGSRKNDIGAIRDIIPDARSRHNRQKSQGTASFNYLVRQQGCEIRRKSDENRSAWIFVFPICLIHREILQLQSLHGSRRMNPICLHRIDKIMLPGDYIAMRLTGEISTSYTGLSEGIFWDFSREQGLRRTDELLRFRPGITA